MTTDSISRFVFNTPSLRFGVKQAATGARDQQLWVLGTQEPLARLVLSRLSKGTEGLRTVESPHESGWRHVLVTVTIGRLRNAWGRWLGTRRLRQAVRTALRSARRGDRILIVACVSQESSLGTREVERIQATLARIVNAPDQDLLRRPRVNALVVSPTVSANLVAANVIDYLHERRGARMMRVIDARDLKDHPLRELLATRGWGRGAVNPEAVPIRGNGGRRVESRPAE